MRRTPLRSRPNADPVTHTVRQEVMRRDGRCLMAVFEPLHVCRDAWGIPHAATATAKLTVEHVKSDLRMGVRAPSDMAHLTLLCWQANTGVPSKAFREFARDYLARVAP